jgi:hypothetical protein
MLLLVLAFVVATAAEGPCDILDAAGNPCVAAHSTVRALYVKYDGPLYNVTRSSDGKSANIGLLSAGGVADKSAHDKFCSPNLDCVISNVFDQSPNGNHLGQRHKLINASKHAITVGKDKIPVYGMWFDPGVSISMHVFLRGAGAVSQALSPLLTTSVRIPRGQDDGHCDGQRPRINLRSHERQELQRRLLL